LRLVGSARPAEAGALDAIVARAVDAVKVYGPGPTEVRALDGVTVEFPVGEYTGGRRMVCGRAAPTGTSPSGLSTAVHRARALAGSDLIEAC
jgi:putative ABC transport system ATP-binding protein